jgi:hypothetical protein
MALVMKLKTKIKDHRKKGQMKHLQKLHRNSTIKTARLERLKSIKVFHLAMNMGR